MTGDLASVWAAGWQDGFAAAVAFARYGGDLEPIRVDRGEDYRAAYRDGWAGGLAWAQFHTPGDGDLPDPPLVPRPRSRTKRALRALNSPRDLPVWALVLSFVCVTYVLTRLIGWAAAALAGLIA